MKEDIGSTRKFWARDANSYANIEILKRHIGYLENKILLNKKFDIEQHPESFCWLVLRSFCISTKMERLRMINDLSGERMEKGRRREMDLGEIKKWLKRKNKDIAALELALEIRHSFSHLGIPHIVRGIDGGG